MIEDSTAAKNKPGEWLRFKGHFFDDATLLRSSKELIDALLLVAGLREQNTVHVRLVDVGHSASHPEIVKALVSATKEFAKNYMLSRAGAEMASSVGELPATAGVAELITQAREKDGLARAPRAAEVSAADDASASREFADSKQKLKQ